MKFPGSPQIFGLSVRGCVTLGDRRISAVLKLCLLTNSNLVRRMEWIKDNPCFDAMIFNRTQWQLKNRLLSNGLEQEYRLTANRSDPLSPPTVCSRNFVRLSTSKQIILHLIQDTIKYFPRCQLQLDLDQTKPMRELLNQAGNGLHETKYLCKKCLSMMIH